MAPPAISALSSALDEVKVHLKTPEEKPADDKWSQWAVIASFKEHVVSKQWSCFHDAEDESECNFTTVAFKCPAKKITEFLTKDFAVEDKTKIDKTWVEEVHLKVWQKTMEGCEKVEDDKLPKEIAAETKEGEETTKVDGFYNLQERFKKDYGDVLGFKVAKISQVAHHADDTYTDRFQVLQCLKDKDVCKMIDGLEIKSGLEVVTEGKIDEINRKNASIKECKIGDKEKPCTWSPTPQYTTEEPKVAETPAATETPKAPETAPATGEKTA